MKLKEWREAHSVSREDLAAKLDCSVETVRRYETGERLPDRDNMTALALLTAGDVTPNDFFDIPTSPSDATDSVEWPVPSSGKTGDFADQAGQAA